MDAKLKRLFWLWHFWAGLIAGPTLMVMAITGAIFIFRPEIELWWYADAATASTDLFTSDGLSTEVEPAIERAMERIGAVEYRPYTLNIETGTGRAPSVLAVSNDGKNRFVRQHFDPADGSLLGQVPNENLFAVVLAIHRRLMVGTPGRILTELTTGWTIAITLLGLVLWWPRNWKKSRGVLLPRIRVKRYVWLRDLHSVGGAWASVIILLIAVTGLMFTRVWGRMFEYVAKTTHQHDIHLDPHSTSDLSLPSLNADQLLTIAQQLQLPTGHMSIEFANRPFEAVKILSGPQFGPSATRLVFLDRVTGAVIKDYHLSDMPPLEIYTQFDYPLHVGSIGGLPTKILWLLTCIALIMLPVFGIAMWLSRRRLGTFGAPHRPAVQCPTWVVLVILGLGVFMPLLGASIIIVAAVDAIYRRRVRATLAHATK